MLAVPPLFVATGNLKARITGDTVTAYKGVHPFGVRLTRVFGRRRLRLSPTDGSLYAAFTAYSFRSQSLQVVIIA